MNVCEPDCLLAKCSKETLGCHGSVRCIAFYVMMLFTLDLKSRCADAIVTTSRHMHPAKTQ